MQRPVAAQLRSGIRGRGVSRCRCWLLSAGSAGSGRPRRLVRCVQVETQPLVSMDFVNDPHSSIVDALSTMVVDGKMVKIYAWYDNEWGYSCRMAEIGKMVIESL